MTELELRDAYVLANKDAIEAEWDQLQGNDKGKDAVETEETSGDGETSGSEGSEYDRHDYDREVNQTKSKRKEVPKRVGKKKTKELAGVILPQTGDKTVAGEAYAKLDRAQKKMVSDKVNKTTKKVSFYFCLLRNRFHLIIRSFNITGCQTVSAGTHFRRWAP
jgi:hypothetical protein